MFDVFYVVSNKYLNPQKILKRFLVIILFSSKIKIHRSSVMSDLRKRTQVLSSLEGAIKAVQDRADTQQNSVSQRLKWAAGANPTLHNVMHEFEKVVQNRLKNYAVSVDNSTEAYFPKRLSGACDFQLAI